SSGESGAGRCPRFCSGIAGRIFAPLLLFRAAARALGDVPRFGIVVAHVLDTGGARSRHPKLRSQSALSSDALGGVAPAARSSPKRRLVRFASTRAGARIVLASPAA